MIELQAQFDGKSFHPYSEQDEDTATEIKPNQIVTLRITGIKDIPKVKQLHTYWSACSWFAENNDNKYFQTKEMVSDQLKVELNFIDMDKSFVDRKGDFHPRYYSIAFANLRQIDRTRYIDRAFEQMAIWKGVSVDDVVRAAKERCKRY